MFELRKNNAYKKVNEEMILLYWDIGRYISDLSINSSYGDKLIEGISNFIKSEYPDIRGFNKRNLERMAQFYKIYKNDEIATPLVTQLSWSNNLMIISRTKTKEERLFYLNLSVKNNYSKRELDRQIGSSYYERYVLSDRVASESSIKTIDEDDYIDLLFYNRELSCLVAFELKIDKFKPEYISKMDFYLEALDRNEKRKNENPSVGIILCAGKDDEVVEFAMSRTMSQTMVAEYKLKLIDKKILKSKLKEIIDLVDDNKYV